MAVTVTRGIGAHRHHVTHVMPMVAGITIEARQARVATHRATTTIRHPHLRAVDMDETHTVVGATGKSKSQIVALSREASRLSIKVVFFGENWFLLEVL